MAESRLPGNLQAPHPGRPEAVTHPDADHMSARKPGTATLVASIRPAAATSYTQKGLDVSSYQGNVNWSSVAANGATFAYMKATEGTYYTDSAYFAQQYNGSYNAGLVRGAYHFAIPSNSTGAAQADYFVAHGGGWSGDGRTRPGTLDIEYNPYGAECYGLTQPQMVSWIQSFDSEYEVLTGRYPTVYTTTGWWSACTGSSRSFGLEGLAIANFSSSPGTLPASWGVWNIWQYADSGVFPGDQDVFNGSQQQLVDFAQGPSTIAASVPLTCATGDQ
ncbi:MAG TPA: lysozyme, partial [Acidimicrobiales bacterium]|nr:lysozyme [Acidimicrobiales bacterium]